MKPKIRTSPLIDAFDWDRLERVVVLSPHIDDAVLSCTGLLSALHGRAPRLVVTLYCGNPESPNPGGVPRPGRARRGHAPPSVRRKEDIAVMRSLDCDWVHLGFQDAIYRRSPTTGRLLYLHPRQRWTWPGDDDAGHVEELFLVLRRLCGNMGPRLLFSPMGIGHHVDHRICATTAVRLASRQTRLLFYEDFPYVIDKRVGSGEDDDPVTALGRLGLTATRRYVVPTDTRRQIEALSLYASQIAPLFGDEAKMRQAVEARRPSEIFWRARPREVTPTI